MPQLIVETKGLTRRFGEQVSVNEVNLEVPEGKIYGFLGPNGAGKTTTIKMLLGLLRADSGTIRIFGQEMPGNSQEILRKVGSLVENPSYYGHLTGYKNLKILSTLLKLPDRRIGEVLEIVRLTSSANRKVSGYSLGMKQRLGIAAALLRDPQLLILDEPTNGLDPAGIQEIRHLMLSLAHDQGMTIMLSSHLLSEVDTIADEIGIISSGKLVYQGALEMLERRRGKVMGFAVERPEEALRTLMLQGFAVEREGNMLSISAENVSMSQAELFKLLGPYGIMNVRESSKSLEELFMELTGKGVSL
ncbi:bacitracin ABC transporter ATP-binding protein [Paenibacillus sp. FSL H7-0357]|uniref:ABC transporter ATP-binding protein n=1 Tax=Paenibacillus sp. FSL H7-0357 TaxID=1536774 RepID=UPI0004F87A0E|nr:ABC transporter ATP-binding protein [Paenibacillus sp. FSL H7-0357]AIQ15923.1 bacitracin ABC transporter ATP-binding protein [Paenibacillus sp. FSL H7-0357]